MLVGLDHSSVKTMFVASGLQIISTELQSRLKGQTSRCRAENGPVFLRFLKWDGMVVRCSGVCYKTTGLVMRLVC